MHDKSRTALQSAVIERRLNRPLTAKAIQAKFHGVDPLLRKQEDGSTSDPQLEAGRVYLKLLRRSLIRLDRLTNELVDPHGLTNQQFLALLVIRDNEKLTQVELTAELDSDQNTVSALVRRLAARHLLTRERHLVDRRAVCLTLTSEGAALVETALPDVDRLSRKLEKMMPSNSEQDVLGWMTSVATLRKVE